MEVCSLSRRTILAVASVRIPPITGRLSLSPSSFTRILSIRAYHVPLLDLNGLGPTYSPVARRLRFINTEYEYLTTSLLGKPFSRFGLFTFTTIAVVHLC